MFNANNLKLLLGFPNIPLLPFPRCTMFAGKHSWSFTNGMKPNAFHTFGQNGADFQYGITNVPLAPSCTSLSIVFATSLGGGTHQFVSFVQVCLKASIPAVPGSHHRELYLGHFAL